MDWIKNLDDSDVGNYWYTHTEKFPGFETIIIPKNFSVYHGGGAMKANVEFPMGLPYYTPIINPDDPRRITAEQREILRNKSIPQDMTKKYSEDITERYIEHSFFGTYETAKAYSSQIPGCGINCVGVYKFREKTNIVDMGDAGTVHSLLFFPNNLDQFDREFLAEAYGITSLDPTRRNEFWRLGQNANLEFTKPVRKSLRNVQQGDHPYRPDKPAYFIIPKLIELFKSFGFKGFANPRTGRRFSEFIIFNPLETLERDISNEIDWQKQPDLELLQEMGILIKNMKLYDTTNIDFHAGDLYAHSVWVALNVQKWMIEDGNKWTLNLKKNVGSDFVIISKLCVISAFLHDIGKMGGLLIFYDKPDHPELGADYLSKTKLLPLKSGNYLDVDALFAQIIPEGFSEKYAKNFIIGIVRFHWLFGDYLRQYIAKTLTLEQAKNAYLEKIRAWWYSIFVAVLEGGKDKYFRIFVTSLMIVSACDVLGSQVFVENKLFEMFEREIARKSKVNVNAFLIGYEYIVNSPKKHRGGDKFKDFKYDTVGFELYNAVYADL